ncbi:MAG: TiaS agmantine-binding domain-containing protein [Nitrososphaerales archaeon]
MDFNTFNIGFEDTDSSDGMCTTFLCYKLVKSLLADIENKTELLDYPNLIRLNPNIPWKTRGNAGLAFRIRSNIPRRALFSTCKNFIQKFATSERANAGLAIFEGDEIPEEIQNFSRRALYSVLGLREVRKLISNFEIESFALRSKQGLVCALASIGNLLEHDHTYELIAYRESTAFPRTIEKSKIIEMSERTFPRTFSSYDSVYGRVMIAPHGPDPVLCGIRGETARDVKSAFEMLLPVRNLGGYMIFRSNQGTGEHLCENIALDKQKAYASGKLIGIVASTPKPERGGHVFFTIRNEDGKIPCACYQPTGDFRRLARFLTLGDAIEVGGGIRKSTSVHPKVLNLEYFRPIKLAMKTEFSNPRCPSCDVSMGSKGWGQGFECPKCGFASKELVKTITRQRRTELVKGKIYLPPIKAHRHLTKPEHRYFFRNKRKPLNLKLVDGWIK